MAEVTYRCISAKELTFWEDVFKQQLSIGALPETAGKTATEAVEIRNEFLSDKIYIGEDDD